jgi:hypothetical protein
MRDGLGWEEVRDWIAEVKVPRANSELIRSKLAVNFIWNSICLTFKMFSVCKDFFMASMRLRLLVDLSQA